MDSTPFQALHDKLDGLHSTMIDMLVTLGKQQVHLDELMRRSNALESSNQALRAEFEPVQKHVAMMHGAAKLVGYIALIGGLLTGVVAAWPKAPAVPNKQISQESRE